MKRMRNCPFCKKEVEDGWPYIHYTEIIDKWVFDHYCNPDKPTTDVCITIYGKSEQEVIDKWNGEYENQESESL
jgi:hypothetical protein